MQPSRLSFCQSLRSSLELATSRGNTRCCASDPVRSFANPVFEVPLRLHSNLRVWRSDVAAHFLIFHCWYLHLPNYFARCRCPQAGVRFFSCPLCANDNRFYQLICLFPLLIITYSFSRFLLRLHCCTDELDAASSRTSTVFSSVRDFCLWKWPWLQTQSSLVPP